MWRWEREFYSDSGIFVLLVGIAGTSGKVLGAADFSGTADFSGAASKEPQESASPKSLLLLPWTLGPWSLKQSQTVPGSAREVALWPHPSSTTGMLVPRGVGVSGCEDPMVPQARQCPVIAGLTMNLARLCTLHQNHKGCDPRESQKM